MLQNNNQPQPNTDMSGNAQSNIIGFDPARTLVQIHNLHQLHQYALAEQFTSMAVAG